MYVRIHSHRISQKILRYWLNCRVPCHSKTLLESVATELHSWKAQWLHSYMATPLWNYTKIFLVIKSISQNKQPCSHDFKWYSFKWRGVLQLHVLLSLRGELWQISIPSCPIQKHSNLQAQRTEQINNEARLFSVGKHCQNKTSKTD